MTNAALALKDPYIRLAAERDIPAILSLIERNLDHLLPRTEAELRENLASLWVTEVEEEIVGSVMLEVYSPKIAEIRSLVVRDDQRGRGLGKLLIEAAVAEGRRRGVREILAITSNPRFFEQLQFGFSPNEKYALFYQFEKRGGE